MELQTTVFHAYNYPYKKPKAPYLAEWDDISLQHWDTLCDNDYGDNEGGNDDGNDDDDDDDNDENESDSGCSSDN